MNIATTYSIDCFPVAVCLDIRITNSRIVKGKEYRGYCASKRSYFYVFKVHIVVTSNGIPVEFIFTAGSKLDLDGLKQMPLNLPEGCQTLADSDYTHYGLEEMLADNGIEWLAARKNNSKREFNPCREYLITSARERIETAFCDMAKYMPKKIHAITDNGFLIKLIAFIWGYTFDKLDKIYVAT